LEGRPSDPGARERGAKIFKGPAGCDDCHGTDAQGDAAIGAPNLTDNVWLYGDGSRKAIFRTIGYGLQGVCPAWFGKLSAASIRETSLFVYMLSHGFTRAAKRPEAQFPTRSPEGG
jgi:cytochrome c oxidase cbb3-type subunit 3